MGFRKGADVDEEMWPTEAFGGVSDEQFWDDLASDKPLTTTARTAQQDPGGRNRALGTVPSGQKHAAQAPGDGWARGEGRRGAGLGAYPDARTGPNPATDRTASQPAAAAQPASAATQPASAATQPASAATQPASAATQPVHSMTSQAQGLSQPNERRGRRRAGTSADDEDPLTSAAFALRPSGPVDGRSSLSPQRSYGENYGYGNGHASPAAQADGAQRQGGSRSHARRGGDGNRTPQQVYPRDGYQGNSYPGGGYPGGGYPGNGNPGKGYPGNGNPGKGYPGNGNPGKGYPGGGYQGDGYRGPYDPTDDYRRLPACVDV